MNAQQAKNLVDTHSPATVGDVLPQPIVVTAEFVDSSSLSQEPTQQPQLLGETQTSASSESFAQNVAYFGSYFFWFAVIGLSAGILLI